MMNKAVQVFEQVIGSIVCLDSYYSRPGGRYAKPGSIIEKLSDEKREVLSHLRVEMLQAVRRDQIVGSDAYYYAQRCSEMMMEFDKKMNAKQSTWR